MTDIIFRNAPTTSPQLREIMEWATRVAIDHGCEVATGNRRRGLHQGVGSVRWLGTPAEVAIYVYATKAGTIVVLFQPRKAEGAG